MGHLSCEPCPPANRLGQSCRNSLFRQFGKDCDFQDVDNQIPPGVRTSGDKAIVAAAVFGLVLLGVIGYVATDRGQTSKAKSSQDNGNARKTASSGYSGVQLCRALEKRRLSALLAQLPESLIFACQSSWRCGVESVAESR